MAARSQPDSEFNDILNHYGFRFSYDRLAYTDGHVFVGEQDVRNASEQLQCSLATAFEHVLSRLYGAMHLLLKFPWNHHDDRTVKVKRTVENRTVKVKRMVEKTGRDILQKLYVGNTPTWL